MEIGWTEHESEREARVDVIRSAWHAAYGHIFSAAEIDGVFEGGIAGHGSWVAARVASAGTLGARRDGRLIGLASLGRLRSGDGELAALYVTPAEQGMGVGTRLWHRSAAEFAGAGCRLMEIWTLARAEARHFYEARGCHRIGEGSFAIAGHSEPAIGYALDLSGVTASGMSTPAR